ncbi:MAG TPA: putative sulfate exporter family transporter, partial [Roseiarcus sp.]|nr:putative sulfate exporter family transporter [Roseiarcus sp.]
PAVLAISVAVNRAKGRRAAAPALPGFLIAFAILVLVNSFGFVPHAIADFANDLSRWCLVTAVAALGMKTSFKELFAVGWRPIGLMIGETAWIAALVLLCVKLVM